MRKPKLLVLLPAHASDQSNKRLLRKIMIFLGNYAGKDQLETLSMTKPLSPLDQWHIISRSAQTNVFSIGFSEPQ